MAASFLIIFAIFSIFANIVALYILIIASFEKKEKKNEINAKFVKRDSRTINVPRADEIPESPEKKTNTRIVSLLCTVLIGQIVGVYFLLVFVGELKIVNTILRINGGFLLLASIICSILTLLNGWLKKKMVVLFRLIFQSYSFIVAIILSMCRVKFTGGIRTTVLKATFVPNLVSIIYISTVIVALVLMLWDGLYRKHEKVDFDFNKYFRLVVLVGMIIGLGLIIGVQMMRRGV